MQILVSGGTGFIGSALVQHLVKEGHSLQVLTRRVARPERRDGIEFVPWNPVQIAGWADAVRPAEVVIHLAGASLAGRRWTARVKNEIVRSRVQGTRTLVEVVRRWSRVPEIWLQTSAVGYYGSSLSDQELDETASPGDDFLAGLCVEWEAASQPVEQMGSRRCILRLGIVLGRDGGALPRMLLPFRLFLGGPIGSGRQWVSWIHRNDVIRIVRFLMERDEAQGAYNATAPQPVTMKTFCQTLGEVLRRPVWLPVPDFALRALFGEGADVLLKGQRVIPERLLTMGFQFQYPTLRDALFDLLS